MAALSNTSYWINPRAAVIGDMILVQGGQRVENGTNSAPVPIDAKDGDLYSINLNCSVTMRGDKARGIDTLFQEIKQTRAVTDPTTWSGNGLFFNTYEFYTFGYVQANTALPSINNGSGLPTKRPGPMDTSIVQGTLYQPPSGAFDANDTNVGPWNPSENGVAGQSLANVSSYVTNGAWTSAPSENRAWWLGGMEALNKGPIRSTPSTNKTDAANTTSRRFIQADLRNPGNAILTDLDLPDTVQTSAEGALIWLPYGRRGILLAFGGVSHPVDLDLTVSAESNDFMTNINVYDVESQTWSVQPTLQSTEVPEQLAQFCTAVVASEDGTGHFIYVHGGYDGNWQTAAPIGESRDAVWVLSVPAFQWTKMHDGVKEHRRQNHVCVTPNPSQMISIGGMTEYQLHSISTIIDVFDLNKNEWVDTYNASSTEPYIVPSKIIDQLRVGAATGGFSVIPTGLNPSVSSLVSTRGATAIAYTPRICNSQESKGGGTTTAAWKKPVMIAVPIVVVLALIAGIAAFYFRRRRTIVTEAESRTETRQHKVMSWLGKPVGHDPPPAASDSTGTEDTMIGTGTLDYFGRPVPKTVNMEIHEVDGRSNMASPISFNESGHGTPYNIASQALSGSHEVDAASRHELDGQTSSESNMSPRNHPLYPASFGGTNLGSTDAGSVSHPSESLRPHPYLGHISPYELPQDKSNENLSQPPNDLSLDESSVVNQPTSQRPNIHMQNNSARAYAGEVHSPRSYTPTSPIARKPVSPGGTHHRQSSSMSSRMYQLPSPDLEEDQRRSTFIASLPDDESRPSYAYSQRQSGRQPTSPIRSAYQENFDDMSRR